MSPSLPGVLATSCSACPSLAQQNKLTKLSCCVNAKLKTTTIIYFSMFLLHVCCMVSRAHNLAAEQLRLMEFDNRLIIDCFSNVVVNILIWWLSMSDIFRSEKYESNPSNYIQIHFQKWKESFYYRKHIAMTKAI